VTEDESKENLSICLNTMLEDQDTYVHIKKDPTNTLTRSARDLLTRWKKRSYITEANYKRVYCSEGNLPRAYGLPKVHKPGVPFRIIISSIDSPLYGLATFLHEIISKNIPEAPSRVDNSFQLVQKLIEKRVDPDYTLISLDVVSLFTNIAMELALEGVSNR
jgi:hypothetical protein